ncbi:hypothetical protein FB451DRAFT_1470077 [Mycena latifolia]|nr:hypothetical protein FB451DRAFT_1470077 [Mycena latifolia]
MINNSSGFQLHGANFYEASGDVIFETHQHFTISADSLHDEGLRLLCGSTMALEDGWPSRSRCELSCGGRDPRHETAKPASYGLSCNPRLVSRDSSNGEEPLAANATDQEKIEYKRRQNALAARRSRKRKLMHQQQLEEAVERLTREKDIWKTRALTLSSLLRSHGIACLEFHD